MRRISSESRGNTAAFGSLAGTVAAALAALACTLPSLSPRIAPAGESAGGGEKLLCSFEKDEVARWGAKFKTESGKEYVTERFVTYVDVGAGTAETATEGKWALVRRINDRYGFLAPGNKTHPYELHRCGTVLNTYGWFRKAFPSDWTGYELLRMDVRAEKTGVRLRLEIEDEFIPEPVAREYVVSDGEWVTIEVDLKQAARERRLDLSKMVNIVLTAVERSSKDAMEFAVLVDKVRLAKAGMPCALKVLRDGSPMTLPPRPKAAAKETAPLNISAAAKADGAVSSVAADGGGYALMAAMDRCIGGFGGGGVIVVPGHTAYLSLDGGKSWTGLDGRPGGTRIAADFRGRHRATATVYGADVLMAFCTDRCAGGGGRTMNKATSAIRSGDRWKIGPETPFEFGQRHCVDRLSMVRDAAGREWVAWNQVNVLHGTEVRAKWRYPGGEEWFQCGENARIYPHGAAGGAGPYLTACGEGVACFWRDESQGALWSRAVPVRTKVAALKEGGAIEVAAGTSAGIRIGANLVMERNGKYLAAFTVTKTTGNMSTAAPDPGPAGIAKEGDELLAFAWSPASDIEKGRWEPSSAATLPDGTVFAALQSPGKAPKVMRLEGGRWVQDSPAGIGGWRPMLSACGGRLTCAWFEGKTVFLCARGPDGKWGGAKKIAEEQDLIETIAAPLVGPENFVPIAWSTKKRDAVKVAAVPLP